MSENILKEMLGEELVSVNSDFADGFYVPVGKEVRDRVLAAKIAGEENMAEEYALLDLGKVPLGLTLNIISPEYASERKKFKSFNALAYGSYEAKLLSTTYHKRYGEEPEAMLRIKPKYCNRMFIAQGSEYSPGAYILASGLPMRMYDGEYTTAILAVARPLLYEEVEYLPLEGSIN